MCQIIGSYKVKDDSSLNILFDNLCKVGGLRGGVLANLIASKVTIPSNEL